MSNSRRVTIEFLGDDKSASRTAKSLDGTTSHLGDTLKRVGKYAAVGLGAGIAAGAVALFNMTKNAAEDEAAQRKLALALKNSTGATDEQIASVEDWIAKQGIALGVTDDELRPAFQRLVESTGSIKKAQYEMGIAMDVSAGTGKSLKVVTEALMKANNGTTASLSRLGLKTKNAKGETISLDDALKKMSETFGGQAAAKADTLQGKMDRLKLMFDETQESIGARLIPVAEALATWILEEGVPAIRRFTADMKEKLGPTVEKTKELFAKMVVWLKQHWPEISATIKEVLTNVKEIVVGVVKFLVAIWRKWGDDITRFTKIYLGGILGQIKAVFKIIRGVLDVFAGLFTGDWDKFWKGIREIFGGAWDLIKNALKTQLRLFRALFDTWWDGVKDLFKKSWDAITAGVSKALGWIKDRIKGILSDIKDWIKSNWKEAALALFTGGLSAVLSWVANRFDLADKIRNVIGHVKDAVRDGISDVADIIRSLPDRIENLPDRMFNMGKHLIGQLKSGVHDMMSDIGSWIKSKVVDPIVNAVLHFFHIKSPSKVFERIGGHLVGGLMKGMSVSNWLGIAKDIFGGLPDALYHIVKQGLVSVTALPKKALAALANAGFDLFASAAGSLDTSLYGNTLSNQQIGRKLLNSFGWGKYWDSFNALVMGESGWNNYAQNPTSSAYGIGQFLDSTWAMVGGVKTSDAGQQIFDMLKYIKMVYGNPAVAYSTWLNRNPHWYRAGLKGGLFTKPTLIGVGEAGPERVSVTPIGREGGGEFVGVVQLVLDGKVIQQSLLKLKRRNGGLELGLG